MDFKNHYHNFGKGAHQAPPPPHGLYRVKQNGPQIKMAASLKIDPVGVL